MDPKRRDELAQNFHKNVRRAMDEKSPRVNSPRSVSFNPETINTSFGGTQTPGDIKDSSILESSTLKSTHSSRNTARQSLKTDENAAPPKPKLQKKEPEKTKKANSNRSSTQDKSVFLNPAKVLNPRNTPEIKTTPVKSLKTTDHSRGTSQTPECFAPVTIETPVARVRTYRRSHEIIQAEDCGLTVAVRVRPFSSRELTDAESRRSIVEMSDNLTVLTTDRGDVHHFAYDYSFWSCDQDTGDFASQEHVYNTLAQPMLGKAFEGYNTCLFAYGQTGSGKSYSMMGHNDETGVIPRFCEELFGRIGLDKLHTKINVEISYFEIYNEKIHDLLGPSSSGATSKEKPGAKKANLKVREHPTLGPYVEDLSSYVVESFEDVKSWLSVGNKHRATAATGMNDKSSRSHSVFIMVLTQSKLEDMNTTVHRHSVTSKINLVDLAGSERQSHAKTCGDRFREGTSINKSLMTLGKVISVLADQSTNTTAKRKKLFIPYRDSVLTWLLKESLGGNSKTAMLATISPSGRHTEETLSTLRYAQQARSIINTARVNEDPKVRLIRELRTEIERLRCQSVAGGDHFDADDDAVMAASSHEITSLREQLALKEREMTEMAKSWQEKLKNSEMRKMEESRLLEKSGIAFTVDNKLPNLVNLNEDPQLSETLLYILREGEMRVGRAGAKTNVDIQLSGPLIADQHCTFKFEKKKMTIVPVKEALTYVNGDVITSPTVLHHGDRVILGGDHYFRFSQPGEQTSGVRKSVSGAPPKDFEYARQELSRIQNDRLLEAELEEARKKHESALRRQESEAKQRMATELARTKQQADRALDKQRTAYEDRLASLEGAMNEHRQKQYESDKHREEANEAYRKLEVEKMMLEQEVLANRKRLDLEAKAAQTTLLESRVCHSKIVEQLEREKMKIQEDVQKLSELKQQRETTGLTPRGLTPRGLTPRTPMFDSSRKDLLKTMLKIREANKISQHFNKQTVFCREEVTTDSEVQPLIKVTNSRLGISTLWTGDKFDERLLQMREMYQACDRDVHSAEIDEVFYDSNDMWEKEARLNTPQGVSPRVLAGLRRQASHDRVPRLTFDSVSSASSLGSGQRGSRAVAPSPASAAPVANMSELLEQGGGPSLLEICRDQIAATMDRFKGTLFKETIPDKLLSHCDVIKRTVAAMLDGHNAELEDNVTSSGKAPLGALSLLSSLQLVTAHCSAWSGPVTAHRSSHVTELYDRLVCTIRKLAAQMGLFLQGVETQIDAMVQESAQHIFDALYSACRVAGEMVVAMETPLWCLRDSLEGSVLHDDDTRIQLAPDTKQYITSGTEIYVDRTVSLALRVVEDSQARVLTCCDGDNDELISSVLRQVELIVASSKVLLSKLQESQMDIDNTLRQLSYESRSDDFYHRNYERHLAMVGHINGVADGVTLLAETTEGYSTGERSCSLRRLLRCAELVQSAVTSLQTSATCDTSLLGDTSGVAGLNDTQTELLNAQTAEIATATTELGRITRGEVSMATSESRSITTATAEVSVATIGDTKRGANNSKETTKKSSLQITLGGSSNPKKPSSSSIVQRNLALFQH